MADGLVAGDRQRPRQPASRRDDLSIHRFMNIAWNLYIALHVRRATTTPYCLASSMCMNRSSDSSVSI
jgi:hypothetical protein